MESQHDLIEHPDPVPPAAAGTDTGSLNELPRSAVIERLHEQSSELGRLERSRLRTIARLWGRRVWRDDDCRDMGHWVALNLGTGSYRGSRIADAALALERLPRVSEALETGLLSLDKVIELTRFATGETETKLISWARRVAPSTIKRRADEECAKDREECRDKHKGRFLRWDLYDDQVWLQSQLPVDAGLALRSAVEEIAQRLGSTDENGEHSPIEQRRADALVELALGDAQAKPEVVVHTRLSEQGFGNGVHSSGVTLHPDLVAKLACDARLRFVLTDEEGNALGIGRASQEIPWWLRQQVLKRDQYTCTFPGCDCRSGLQVHHTAHWAYGGPTDFGFLAADCPRHHDFVHLHDWRQSVRKDGTVDWFKPNGERYIPGPSPPGAIV